MRKIIASLDVGSNYIKLIIGEIFKKKLNILTCIDVPARGIKNGYIVNPESAIVSFKEVFSKASDIMGMPVNKVVVSIPSYNTKCFYSEGSTSINGVDKVINHKAITRSIEAAVYNRVPDNHELISVLPTSFIINDVDKVASPIGAIGEKLTVKAVSVIAPKNNIISLLKCLEKVDVQVVDTVVGPLADYYEFRKEINNNEVGAIVNIGASKTEVSIFNKGILTNTEVLDVGSNNIEADFAYMYKISRKDAIYIKENLALAHKSMAQANESVTFTNKQDDLVKINQYDASEIVNARLVEMLNLIKKQINLLTKREISYIMVTGGTTELKDFNILLDEVFNRKAKIAHVNEIGIRHNKYSVAAGLIKYYYSRLKLRNADFSIFDIDQQEELSGLHRKINLSDNSLLGKLFGYFFDS